jgi:hypothetical protein
MDALHASIVFSQRTWAGVGDLDDCWCLSLLQATNACAPWLGLPGVPAVRKAAGDPDDGKHDGGNLVEIHRATLALWPELVGRLTVLRDVSTATLQAAVRQGRPVSVATMADKLPPRIRYGAGAVAHQVTIAQRPGGQLILANPLAPMGSRWDQVSWSDVLPAVRAYGNGSAFAMAWPTITEMADKFPGVAELVAKAHGQPDPAAIAAATAAGHATGFADAKAKASRAVAGIAP